jgi:hypothetical protein
MTAETHLSFPHEWIAEILPARPLILPPRHYVYPRDVEEVERGALEVLVRPAGAGVPPFLATCALGFRDPIVPTGIWSAPNQRELCAVCGGYAYLIDTTAPEQFTMISYRPVLQVIPVVAPGLLLFAGSRTILAWGRDGQAWESPRLSDEGITVSVVEDFVLRGMGWNMMTDKEGPFSLDLRTGNLVP